MKRILSWQSPVAMVASVGLAVVSMATPSLAMQPAPAESNSLNLSTQQEAYQVAQATADNCRQIRATGGVTVREEPSGESEAVGEVLNGRNVTIVNRGAAGWVPISAPLSGYVPASFLILCPDTAAPPPSNCREVRARPGLNVRREPSINSTVVGFLTNRQQITIDNLGSAGWVALNQPIDGYVAARYLAYCP